MRMSRLSSLRNLSRHFSSSSLIARRGSFPHSLSSHFLPSPGVRDSNSVVECARRFCFSAATKENDSTTPYALGFRSFIHTAGRKDFERGGDSPLGSSKPMDYVRGLLDQETSQLSHHSVEYDADFVHIKLMRNNTFVTVTDSKGNKKFGASSGSLPDSKGGAKLSRYAAEATAEHVGREARKYGLKSVVVRVKGFAHFKKKRQAIMSFKEGYSGSNSNQNPIVYIEDVTRKPHNGCRLPRKRRI